MISQVGVGISQAPTTYFEFAAGLKITPTLPSSFPYLRSVIFRPEVRYDASLNDTTPFDAPLALPGVLGTKSTWSRSTATSS